MTSIVWFRRDRRLRDNPAFDAAVRRRKPVVPVTIWDETIPSNFPLVVGSASRTRLHHSLSALGESLLNRGLTLLLFRGNTGEQIASLVEQANAAALLWNCEYKPHHSDRSRLVEDTFDSRLKCESFNGRLLIERSQLSNKSNKPCGVFTLFWRHFRVVL